MARYGRSYPAPVRTPGPPWKGVRQQVALPVFESLSEWPALEIVTPNVNLALPVFESLSEWPSLPLRYEQRFALPAFESLSEWPSVTVSIPVKPGDSLTGEDGQVEWNGVLWGPTTDVRVRLPVDGWMGMPGVDNLNVEKPGSHGAWDARKLAQQRIVSLRLQPDSAADPTQIQTLLDGILGATGLPDGDTPLPLVIKAYGAPRLAYGQVVDRPLQLDGDYNVGLPSVGVIIACGDPRLYLLEPQGVTIPVSETETLANSGNASTHPLIRMEGPVTNPVLNNQTMTRLLQFTITVADGEILEIDTKNGTASIGSVNKMSTLTGGVPVSSFVLQAGPNTIQYTAASGGANGADFTWLHATI